MSKKIVNINVDKKKFFKYWLEFTKPFHHLPEQEQQVLSMLLYHYFELKKSIKKESLIWKMVFDYDTKAKIKEELNDLPDYTLQNILSRLRKKKVIENNKINGAYIPNINNNTKQFLIAYQFKFV